MLSYRHAFHAGNFADLLKHCVLVECILYLKRKDTPFTYFDTHAGPGSYALDSDFALKNREFETGIRRIWDMESLPEVLTQYRQQIRDVNPHGTLRNYPGSPAIAARLLRPADRICLCELHRTENERLQQLFKFDRRAEVWREDGFQRSLKQLPPRERRGLILIDPSYELKEDFQRVVDYLMAAYRKFAQAIYLLWYPVVERHRINQLEDALSSSGIRNIERFELGIQADSPERGMTASGMIVINPPWTLHKNLKPTLDFLSSHYQKTHPAAYAIYKKIVEE